MRKPGPINDDEVDAYQRRYGLQVDRDLMPPKKPIFGDQCMGQLLDLENELLRNQTPPFSFPAFLVGGVVFGLLALMF